MKQQVDNLIANILLKEGEVCLPQVGTLILVRNAAKLTSKSELQAPHRELRFTREERGTSLVAHLVKVASLSDERASDIYAEWRNQSFRNDILTIGGVCSVENNKVEVDVKFDSLANPGGRRTIKVTQRKGYLIYILASLSAMLALCVGGYLLHTNGLLDLPSIAKEEQVAENSDINITIEPIPDERVVTEVVETIEAPAADSLAQEKPAEEVVAQTTTLPMTKGRSYAVWGVYAELKNAESAKAWLNSKYPEIDAQIYEYDDRYMVALCELTSRTACGKQISAWKAKSKNFQNVWVYTR
ncbi:MAG: hypothetical protein IIV24_04105 [Alistipes sp.]|nr:hypothetical protein [Alistipes sp.]